MSVRDDIDPLDAADPIQASWNRFRLRFANARLLAWFFSEIDNEYPDYFRDLHDRLQSSLARGAMLKANGRFKGLVPVVSLNGTVGGAWLPEEEVTQACEELFPYGPAESPQLSAGAGLVVLLLYSALEALASELRVYDAETSEYVMIGMLNGALDLQDLDPEAFDDLVNLSETQEVISQCGGKVTLRFLRHVRNAPFEEGEDRVISSQELDRFSRVVFWAAELTYRFAGGSGLAT